MAETYEMQYQGAREFFTMEDPTTTECNHRMMFPNDDSSKALSPDGGKTQYRRGGCQLCGIVLAEQTVGGKHMAFYRKVK
jgi:hypothetical protein